MTEYHLKYSTDERPGTFHEEVSGFDWRFVFYCPVCGLYWKTPDFYPSDGDKTPTKTFYHCTSMRGGCGAEAVVYFDKD